MAALSATDPERRFRSPCHDAYGASLRAMEISLAEQFDVIVGMGVAMVLGGLVGLEREIKRRPAGFRTHMLVAAAAALLMGIGQMLVRMYLDSGTPMLRMDPLRLVESVIAGVAFIGAGTIFSESRRGGGTITGITTAASLLMVATIGVAAGLAYYLVAVAATALTLFVLVVLSAWERWRARAGSRGAGAGSD